MHMHTPCIYGVLTLSLTSQRVASVRAFEAHLDMIVACAEAFYGGDGADVQQEEAPRQGGSEACVAGQRGPSG